MKRVAIQKAAGAIKLLANFTGYNVTPGGRGPAGNCGIVYEELNAAR